MVKAVNNTINIKEIYTEKTKNLFDLEEKKACERSPAGYPIIAVVKNEQNRTSGIYRDTSPKDTNKHKDSTKEQQLLDQHLATFITKSEIEIL